MDFIIEKKCEYKLGRHWLNNVMPHQVEKFADELETDENGDFIIKYISKSYKQSAVSDQTKDFDTIAISFFSGAGGLDIGTQLAGVKVVASFDIYEDSVKTLKNNKCFDGCEHFCLDVKELSKDFFKPILEKYKSKKLILVGGPPCQPFSKAGYWKTNEKRKGVDDPRNMIGEYLRLIAELQPDGFILENVESILHPTNKIAADTIMNTAKELGYNIDFFKLNAANFGVPQKRKRVFFIASKNVNQVLTDIKGFTDSLEPTINWIGQYIGQTSNQDTNAEGKYYEDLLEIPPGKNYMAITEKNGKQNAKFKSGSRYWLFLLKLHPLIASNTIIADPGHWEGPFHWENRRLTNVEAAAIQTFPEDYVFTGSVRSQHKQIGNAVPPILAYHVVQYLKEIIWQK